jgi:putative transcriptional regulator
MRKNLIRLRKIKGLTVNEVAEKLNISASFYYKIENGNRTPSFKKSLDIKKFFDYYNDDIFHNEEDSTSILI